MIETHATSAYRYPLLIKHLWHTPLRCNPGQEIVSTNGMRYDYATLYSRIDKLASGLAALGVKAGDTVAVMDWDNHRYLECFFAIPMMGAILHTINVRLSPEQILFTINHAQDDVILVHADFITVIDQIKGRFDRPVKLVYLSEKTDFDLPKSCMVEYESMLETARGEFEFDDFDENTPATTFYTTGTTGEPKGVFYSHRQLVLHTLALIAGLGSADNNNRFHRGDVYMPITPMFHVHAWGLPYAATLMGVKQVYPGRYEPARLLGLIKSEGVTFSHCVPTILHMLLTAPEVGRVDLSNWKVIIGGAALSKGLALAAAEKSISTFAAYGMSETCPFVTAANLSGLDQVTTDEASLARRCKTGQPTVLVDLRVVDADMNDIPRGGAVTGEIVTRTPWLTQGYTGNPAASETLWNGGYMHTGDVGYIDDEGSLHITDRMKDAIKSGGEWISSLELEDIVSRCDGVAEVAAFGIPDARWGERPMIVVVKADQALTEEDIRSAVEAEVAQGRLSKWAIPERIEFADKLPKTSVGKMDKKVMRIIHGPLAHTEPASIGLLRLIQEQLRQRESHSPGVAEVLTGLNRHLDGSHTALEENPVLPADRAGLLDQSIAGIVEPSLQPLAERIKLARNRLTWRVDYGLFYPEEADVGQAYLDGNMHCELIGPNGCVFRDNDFSLGLFMLAPATFYRDHDHAAPELYFNLTGPCGWRFDKGIWQDFGAGSLVWNPEGLAHAMRTYEQPFLSMYSWTSNADSLCRVVPADDWQEIEAQLASPESNLKIEKTKL